MPPRLQRAPSTSLKGPRPPSIALSIAGSYSDDGCRSSPNRASCSSYLSSISEDSVLSDTPSVALRRRPHLVCVQLVISLLILSPLSLATSGSFDHSPKAIRSTAPATIHLPSLYKVGSQSFAQPSTFRIPLSSTLSTCTGWR